MVHTKKSAKYKRIVLKFSGEAFSGTSSLGIDFTVLHYIVAEVKPLLAENVQVGIVVGGGNLFRGAELKNVDRVTGDHMGMLATLMNALALRDAFLRAGIYAEAMSAIPLIGLCDNYNRKDAIEDLNEGKVLIFGGGTGNPLVTTDTALALRGIELDADLILKATNVDGVYSSNPTRDLDAKLYSHLTYTEALEKQLKVMDLAAFCMCRDHNMSLRVYNMHKTGALARIIRGEDEGTLLDNEG
ncbi:MAG: UMP kinase [Gammaproteobacteria bacterium]